MDWNINGNVNFIIIVESLLFFYSIAVGFAKHIYMIPKAETLVTKRKNILFFRCFISIILVLVGYYFLSYDNVIFKNMEQSVSNGVCFVLALLLVLLYVIKVRNRQMTVGGEINSSIKELIKKNNRCVRKIMQPMVYKGREFGTLKFMNALEDVVVFYPPMYLEKKEELVLHNEFDKVVKEIKEFNMYLSERAIIFFSNNKVYYFHYDEIVRVVKGKNGHLPSSPLLFVLADGAEFVVRFPFCNRYVELFVFLKWLNRNIEIIEE